MAMCLDTGKSMPPPIMTTFVNCRSTSVVSRGSKRSAPPPTDANVLNRFVRGLGMLNTTAPVAACTFVRREVVPPDVVYFWLFLKKLYSPSTPSHEMMLYRYPTRAP